VVAGAGGGAGLVEGRGTVSTVSTVNIGFPIFLYFLGILTLPFPDTGREVGYVNVEGGIVMSCT
jgi:hypothetical protein